MSSISIFFLFIGLIAMVHGGLDPELKKKICAAPADKQAAATACIEKGNEASFKECRAKAKIPEPVAGAPSKFCSETEKPTDADKALMECLKAKGGDMTQAKECIEKALA